MLSHQENKTTTAKVLCSIKMSLCFCDHHLLIRCGSLQYRTWYTDKDKIQLHSLVNLNN